jgi:hypothetical protein
MARVIGALRNQPIILSLSKEIGQFLSEHDRLSLMTYPMFVDQELPPVRVDNIRHLSSASSDRLEKIAQLDKALERYFAHKTSVNPALSRQVVSYQANKIRPISRWYRFKEAFSDSLVEYLFTAKGINQGPVLDPFAGSGTTLFASSSMGLDSHGIELLPIGQEVIAARQPNMRNRMRNVS